MNIKVDREERPDIDQIYMAALHAIGEQGGWPLTMFLTPDGRPIWGGTYFPPTARYGRPGFVDLLREVSRLYRDEPDVIANNAGAIMAHLAETVGHGPCRSRPNPSRSRLRPGSSSSWTLSTAAPTARPNFRRRASSSSCGARPSAPATSAIETSSS